MRYKHWESKSEEQSVEVGMYTVYYTPSFKDVYTVFKNGGEDFGVVIQKNEGINVVEQGGKELVVVSRMNGKQLEVGIMEMSEFMSVLRGETVSDEI